VCGIARDASRWLPKYLATLDQLSYPKDLLSYSYVEGGSKDNTLTLLTDWLVTKPKFTFTKRDLPEIWNTRRRMWVSVNLAFHALDDEDYIFYSDCDIIDMPTNLLQELIKKDVDILHPYVYVEQHPERIKKKLFYDTWAFRFKNIPWKNDSETAVNMIPYADENGLIEMLSVGANPVLLKREVVEEVKYHGDFAVVGFCELARRLGFSIYSIPELECIHSWESI
jgi:hypothetical protein